MYCKASRIAKHCDFKANCWLKRHKFKISESKIRQKKTWVFIYELNDVLKNQHMGKHEAWERLEDEMKLRRWGRIWEESLSI